MAPNFEEYFVHGKFQREMDKIKNICSKYLQDTTPNLTELFKEGRTFFVNTP